MTRVVSAIFIQQTEQMVCYLDASYEQAGFCRVIIRICRIMRRRGGALPHPVIEFTNNEQAEQSPAPTRNIQ